MPTVVTLSTGAMNRATIGVTVHAHALPRATQIGHADGDPTRYENPALACLLRREEQPSRQRPLRCGFATSTLRSCCSPDRHTGCGKTRATSPPVPHVERRDAACSFTVPCPASPDPMRHLHRVNACRRLGAGSARRLTGFRGVEHPASQAGKLDLFQSSTSSPQPLSSSSKSGPQDRPSSSRPRRDSADRCGLRPHRTALSRRPQAAAVRRALNHHASLVKGSPQNADVWFARILVTPPATHFVGLVRNEKPPAMRMKELAGQRDGPPHDIDCSTSSLG